MRKKSFGDLVINKIQTSGADIRLLAPKGSLPTNITLPESFNLTGSIAGSMQSARANLNLGTNLGSVAVNGAIKNATDSIRAEYDATVKAQNLQLGKIMQNDTMFGNVTATIKASGKGFAQKTAAANVDALINSATLNKYTYNDVALKAKLANQAAIFSLNINDPNLTIDVKGNGDISGTFPAIAFNAVIDSINAKALNFTPDTLIYKGTITADFKTLDPANLDGELRITKSVLATGSKRYPFDSISVVSGQNNSGKFLRFVSDVMSAELAGEYNLARTGYSISAFN